MVAGPEEKNAKGKKTSRASLLKKAAKKLQVPFEEKNCRRNGCGPLLVTQVMMRLKALEEEKFSTEVPCFDVDGKCLIQNSQCEGVMWEAVANNAHSFLCAECLVYDSVQGIWTCFDFVDQNERFKMHLNALFL